MLLFFRVLHMKLKRGGIKTFDPYKHKIHKGMPYIDIPHLIESAKKHNSAGQMARHKLAVLTRDGFKCVNCSKTDTLTIAHINPPKRKKRRNATSYKVQDCITLCVECHQNSEGK